GWGGGPRRGEARRGASGRPRPPPGPGRRARGSQNPRVRAHRVASRRRRRRGGRLPDGVPHQPVAARQVAPATRRPRARRRPRAPRRRASRVRSGAAGESRGEPCPRRRSALTGRGASATVLPGSCPVGHFYIAQVRVRHDELDAFGRTHPSAYLRHLAQVAIDASSDAGFDARWYAEAGAQWLVRRTTFAVPRPWRADSELSVRTWVEDFRRVRSRRCYEASERGDAALTAQTDWVFVDVATGRPRRVPEAMEVRFGMAAHAGRARTPWRAPAPPPAPGRSTYRVRWAELDALGHMNNAAYLDLLVQ